MHEAQYEFKSVEYAVMCAENKLAQPIAVIAGGSWEVQVAASDAFHRNHAAIMRQSRRTHAPITPQSRRNHDAITTQSRHR